MVTTLILYFIVGYILIHLGIVWYEYLQKKLPYQKIKFPSPLVRSSHNPILHPKANHGDEHNWEAEAVFNPAAITDKTGRIHILYRAIGRDGMSRIGYDSSEDGIHFDDRLPYPVFTMKSPRQKSSDHIERFDPVIYPSGGSWGGCEDPRMVSIDGKIYVTFTVFDSWDFIRIAYISIDEEDFFAKRFRWSRPLLISPDNEINKNWVLFPKKINGKFAVLHRISPDIQIDYVNRLEDLSQGRQIIRSKGGKSISRNSWDTWVRGAGPPPLWTSEGWLILYHAINKHEAERYQVGAMLLDLYDPKKIIARSQGAILSPDMWYENDSKPGVVYVCGAVIKNDILYIYYGGGDKHVCVASAPLHTIMSTLKPVNY